MGTSSTTPGPKGPEWTSAKGAATRLARGTAGATPERVVRRAAAALAGSGGGTWSPGSTAAAQRIAAFLGRSVAEGVAEAARQFEIGTLEDKPAAEVIMLILDWIAADAVALDDQSARRAAEAVLSELVREDVDLEQPLNPGRGVELFRSFLVQYLTRSILTPLEGRLTDNATATQARSHEQRVADVVDALIHLQISPEQLTETDWLGAEGAAIFEQIRDDAIDILADDDS